MTRAYNVIDADGHILEPLDLWDRYMEKAEMKIAPSTPTLSIAATISSPVT